MISIHFVDNTTITEAGMRMDRHWKLRPWTEYLRKNCLNVTPEEYQSMDEIMVVFKVKYSLRKYLAANLRKWGFKLWGSCVVSCSLDDFDLYQGKKPTGRKL